MKKNILHIISILIFISGFTQFASAGMRSRNFRIPTSIVAGGGTAISSDNFQLNGTLGLPSPLTEMDDPPGSEHYILFPGFWHTTDAIGPPDTTFVMDIIKGWSLISLPVLPDKANVQELFPEAIVVYGYKKGAGYVRVQGQEKLLAGRGYWILLNEGKTYTLTGQPIEGYTLSVNEDGWHIIGGCTNPAHVSTDNGNIDVIYRFVPGIGYQRVLESEELIPGEGYWILLTQITGQTQIYIQ